MIGRMEQEARDDVDAMAYVKLIRRSRSQSPRFTARCTSMSGHRCTMLEGWKTPEGVALWFPGFRVSSRFFAVSRELWTLKELGGTQIADRGKFINHQRLAQLARLEGHQLEDAALLVTVGCRHVIGDVPLNWIVQHVQSDTREAIVPLVHSGE